MVVKCNKCGLSDHFVRKCSYCGLYHCSEHLFPENHDCMSINTLRPKNVFEWIKMKENGNKGNTSREIPGRWIMIGMGMVAPLTERKKLEARFKKCASSLNWEYKSKKNSKPGKRKKDLIEIGIFPKGHMLSLLDFMHYKEKLIRYDYEIYRDTFYDKNNKQAKKFFKKGLSIEAVSDEHMNIEDFVVTEQYFNLHYSYHLSDRVLLEKISKKDSLKAFDGLAKAEIKKSLNKRLKGQKNGWTCLTSWQIEKVVAGIMLKKRNC